MKVREVALSVFELATVTPLLALSEWGPPGARRWRPRRSGDANWWRSRGAGATEQVHLMHVRTDAGVEGACTVGDVRYRVMSERALAQLRALAIGEDALDRERLNGKLRRAARFAFLPPGWAGAFDNCLWDIAGKVAGAPVYELLGRVRAACPAYYNSGGGSVAEAVEDSRRAVALGFTAVKDHFGAGAAENPRWFAAVREAVGPEVVLMHDAAENAYTGAEAVQVGRALEDLSFLWFEEPLSDRDQAGLQRLCRELAIPVAGAETLMHDHELCAQWLLSGTVDILRGNARHGVTPLLALARLAAERNTTVELNGPGGLFGLVHAHLCCAIPNTRYYEYFPGGSRDAAGSEIGLTNPPLPVDGAIAPPPGHGWGAEWDWDYLHRHRVATL